MGFWSFFVFISILAYTAYWYGNTKALRLNSLKKDGPKLPSLPQYYGLYSFIWLIIPAVLFIVIWLIFKPLIIDQFLLTKVPLDLIDSFAKSGLLLDTIKSINVDKPFPGTDIRIIELANEYKNLNQDWGSNALIIIVVVSLISAFIAIKRISVKFRARQSVEKSNIHF